MCIEIPFSDIQHTLLSGVFFFNFKKKNPSLTIDVYRIMNVIVGLIRVDPSMDTIILVFGLFAQLR